MLVSDLFWTNFIEDKPELQQWKMLFNKYANNGVLIDTDDTTSFVNLDRTKGIKLTYKPEMDEVYFDYESQFGDEIVGYIDILNVLFSDLEKAKVLFEVRFNEWVKNSGEIL